jgi:hypothetical protein
MQLLRSRKTRIFRVWPSAVHGPYSNCQFVEEILQQLPDLTLRGLARNLLTLFPEL